MHNEKFVTCIKVAGKILKENGDKVYIPFGSEYSLYFKNLNSVRALVRVELDGISVTDGDDLVIGANNSFDLERFLKKGNLSQGNRFKFIERTSKVENHRGVQAEDGLLRIEFQFEKLPPKVEHVYTKTIHHHEHRYDYPWYRPGVYYNCAQPVSYSYTAGGAGVGMAGNLGLGDSVVTANACNSIGSASGAFASSVSDSAPVGGSAPKMRSLLRSASLNNAGVAAAAAPVNDAGITVPGSISNQQFMTVSSFPVETEKHVIVLKLLGCVGDKAIKQAITTKYKQTCVTCGTRNRGKLAQFCKDCGTALELV